MQYAPRNIEGIKNFIAEYPEIPLSEQGSYTYISSTSTGEMTWVNSRGGRVSHHKVGYDVFMFNLGYRRDLTQEELTGFIKGKLNGPWFQEWLEKTFETFDNYIAFKRYINSTFNVRSRVVLCSDGTVAHKKDVRVYTIWREGDISKEIIKHIPSSMLWVYMSNGEKLYFEQEDMPRYNINGSVVTLYEIIIHNFTECEEHPDHWFKYGEACNICAQRYKIHSYQTDALSFFSFRKLDKEKRPVYYGVELEFDTPPVQVAHALRKHTHHMIAKYDGSIRGFELVTAPATFPIHKEEFSTFPFQDQVVTSSDGMHVHIDKSALTTLQIGKLCEWVYNPENLNLLTKIAGRVPGGYCSTNVFEKGVLGQLQEHKDGLHYNVEGSHQTAINISRKNTVEIRIFRTPENYEQFMARLEFVKAMVDWTAPGAVGYGFKEFKNANRFLNFVTDSRKVYPHLFNEII
jgi:hypothetical protein